MSEVSVVETVPYLKKGATIVHGLPEVGLVGPIAAIHLVESLKLSETGSIESELFPPVAVMHRKKPIAPARIYAGDSLMAVLSEIPIPSKAVYPLKNALVNWYMAKQPKLVVMLGGFPVHGREDIEKPHVIGAASNSAAEEVLAKNKVELLEEGFVVGPHGLILLECSRKNIPAIYLMAEAYYAIPDPGAAAAIIEVLNKMLSLNVDVKPLLEKEGEIRLKTKDLMKRTAEYLKKMQKVQEQELPVMYG